MNRLPSRLLVVTDRHHAARPMDEIVADVLAGGGRWIWFRDKELDPEARRRLACRLLAIAQSRGALLSIGGDVDLAEDIGAGGVHLQSAAAIATARKRLGADTLIGLSAHGMEDVRQAADAGADYATLSPIFPTPSKPGYGPTLGVAAIRAAVGLGIPVIALGGIAGRRIDACLAAGAAGVAVMGGVMRSENPARIVEKMMGRVAKIG